MVYTGHKPVPINIIQKALKSICNIYIYNGNEIDNCRKGFFIRIFSQKYLITFTRIDISKNYDSSKQNGEIEVEIYTNARIKIEFNQRFIKYLEKPKGILIIEIKDSDFMNIDIEFLDYDQNYINKGYSIYKNSYVFCFGYKENKPLGTSGKVKNIINDYEFENDIDITSDSIGYPIILLNNNINNINVIGIHEGADLAKNINIGIFIGEIIKSIPKKLELNKLDLNKNKIFEYNNNININKKIYNNIDNNLYDYKLNNNINNLNINNNPNIRNNNSFNYNKQIYLKIDLTKKENKDIIYFNIISTDQSFNCNIYCRINDRFNTVINTILEKEPSITEKIGCFLCNGNKVNEYKTIKDNGIKNNDTVLMEVP